MYKFIKSLLLDLKLSHLQLLSLLNAQSQLLRVAIRRIKLPPFEKGYRMDESTLVNKPTGCIVDDIVRYLINLPAEFLDGLIASHLPS